MVGKAETASPSQSDVSAQRALAELSHSYLIEHIKLADTKAAFLFGAVTAMIAYLAAKGAMWPELGQVSVPSTVLLAIVGVVLMLTSGVFSLAVIWPSSEKTQANLIFWKDVCSHGTGERYSGRVAALSETEVVRQLTTHCFDLSVVCNRKYRRLNIALLAGLVGLISFFNSKNV